MISENEAFQLIKNSSKYNHAIMASQIMEELARMLGENAEEWKIVGLLHDLDHDETRDAPHQHGIVASEKLKGRLPDHCIHAIRSHDNRTGLKAESKLDKALVASDSLANPIEKMDKTSSELSVTTLRAELKCFAEEDLVQEQHLAMRRVRSQVG
jgi:putative nucleotidyltransferase with HDIG domain